MINLIEWRGAKKALRKHVELGSMKKRRCKPLKIDLNQRIEGRYYN
jgi:IS5 family transposase